MPTKKPRITVTLEPEIADLLLKYSEALGVSQAFIINDMLKNAKTSILTLISLAERVKKAPKEVQLEMMDKLESKEINLNKALEEFSQLRLDD